VLNTKAEVPNFVSQVWVQPHTAARNVTLLAFAADCRAAAAPLLLGAGRAAIDRYLLPAGATAANPPHTAETVDSWGTQTDRQSDSVPLHRPCRMHILDYSAN